MGLIDNMRNRGFIQPFLTMKKFFEAERAGFTLIEIIATMIIATVIGLGITMHFVAEYRFRSIIQERVAISKEARIAMDSVTRVLRFADPNNTAIIEDDINFDKILRTTIIGGHLKDIALYDTEDNDVTVWYGWTDEAIPSFDLAAYTLSESHNYGESNESWRVIATSITDFSPNLDELADRELTINLTVESKDGTLTLPLQTKIRLLGK